MMPTEIVDFIAYLRGATHAELEIVACGYVSKQSRNHAYPVNTQ